MLLSLSSTAAEMAPKSMTGKPNISKNTSLVLSLEELSLSSSGRDSAWHSIMVAIGYEGDACDRGVVGAGDSAERR